MVIVFAALLTRGELAGSGWITLQAAAAVAATFSRSGISPKTFYYDFGDIYGGGDR